MALTPAEEARRSGFDPRREILVTSKLYQKYGLAQKPEPKPDRFAGLLAGIAVLALGWAAGFWISGWFV